MATFTAIAAGISMTAAVGQGVGGAAQAAKLRKDQKRAQRAASRAIQESRRGLTANVQEEARIRTFAFDEAMRRQQVQTSEAIQALQATGARGVLSGVQGVQTQATEAMLGITAGMELKEQEREKAILQQEQANIDALRELNLAEAEGATAAAAAAATARAQAISSSLQGFGAAASKASDMAALYDEGASGRLGMEVFELGDEEMMAGLLGSNYAGMPESEQLSMLKSMSPRKLRTELRDYRRTQDLLNR